jgi:hypothetical protein
MFSRKDPSLVVLGFRIAVDDIPLVCDFALKEYSIVSPHVVLPTVIELICHTLLYESFVSRNQMSYFIASLVCETSWPGVIKCRWSVVGFLLSKKCVTHSEKWRGIMDWGLTFLCNSLDTNIINLVDKQRHWWTPDFGEDVESPIRIHFTVEEDNLKRMKKEMWLQCHDDHE